MQNTAPGGPLTRAEETFLRMREVAADLSKHGLTTELHNSQAGLDVTATLRPPGRREAEIIIDEDGYVEVRYWNPPDASAAEVTTTALCALTLVTGVELAQRFRQ